MKLIKTIILLTFIFFVVPPSGFAQENLPKDYLTKEFHAGRRDALRALLPANCVAVIFAYPLKAMSNDNTYLYHQNPDLYYFSGYKESSAVLLIFKEMQHDADGDYNELFFVQHRDPAQEQWTGKRLGVEGVKNKLGFTRVFNSEDFAGYAMDLKKLKVIYDELPEDQGNMKPLYDAFKAKAGVFDVDADLFHGMATIKKFGSPKNLATILNYLKPRFEKPAFKNSGLLQGLLNKPDSTGLAAFKASFAEQYGGLADYADLTSKLRGVKTMEEMDLVRKAVKISALAHAEVMRTIRPDMSEKEIAGIFEYVHSHYGAEQEGYPPIVGSGANSCILHYEEGEVTRVKDQLVLMDVAAEYHGYTADVTRTVPADGKFTAEQKAIYQVVYNAQEEVFKLCKEGIPFNQLEDKSRDVLASGLIKLGIISDPKDVFKYYPHAVSHHLGLDVHDKGEHGLLKENMVITVEPGIYIPEGSPCDKKYWNIGVRIEDDVQIGKDHCTLLSVDAPRRWEDVEKMAAEKSFFDLQHLPGLK